ncbi:hypothetical protein OIU84_007292 [Salix udensis]|uniref:Uncharacterized protein n=1 Tax=Salix udensis TaxID=889485 RepID=A0AAD6NZE3_9ROSI|nr:hypothetical protein OIU84_007292 [Salix udensis]
MDHRGSTAASSHYFDDIHFPSERQIGFWKPNVMPDQQVGMDGKIDIPSGNCAASLPMERFFIMWATSNASHRVIAVNSSQRSKGEVTD